MANEEGFTSALRKMLPFTTALLLIALLYVGWTFYSRRRDVKEEQSRQAAQQAEQARATIAKLGGDRVKVLSFALSTAAVHKGQSARLCYGVSNAKTISIDPPVGDVWPSMSRCVDVHPVKDTTYTLTAQDAAGHTETAQLTLQVR